VEVGPFDKLRVTEKEAESSWQYARLLCESCANFMGGCFDVFFVVSWGKIYSPKKTYRLVFSSIEGTILLSGFF